MDHLTTMLIKICKNEIGRISKHTLDQLDIKLLKKLNVTLRWNQLV